MGAAKMLEVLRIGREKLSDKGTTSANKRVAARFGTKEWLARVP